MELTIQAIRAALPEDQREAFQSEVDSAPAQKLPGLLDEWALRARYLALPETGETLDQLQAEWDGRRPVTAPLSDAEMREMAPALRP